MLRSKTMHPPSTTSTRRAHDLRRVAGAAFLFRVRAAVGPVGFCLGLFLSALTQAQQARATAPGVFLHGANTPQDWTLLHPAGGLVAGQQCVPRAEGKVECQRRDNSAFVYIWPVTSDMIGQTVNAVSLTPGVTLFPQLQRIGAGQTPLTFEISGAKVGDKVRILKNLK